MNTFMRIFLTLLLAATLVLAVDALGGIHSGRAVASPDKTQGDAPPVEQPLVAEGAFAVELVQALNMGQTDDEAQAENLLSAVGIEPQNGWIAQYPVTPPILVEIEEGVARAADGGKLRMGKDQALRAVADLKSKLGLNITSGSPPSAQSAPPAKPGNGVIYKYTDKYGVINFTDRYESIPQEYRAGTATIRQAPHPQVAQTPAPSEIALPAGSPEGPMAAPSPPAEVVNNYYYDPGPPVVTYYVPPPDYYYLYSWVPYPFWWSGFYFGGFFILNDFHRHVSFHGRPCVVSNHSFQARNYRSTVYPVGRGLISTPAKSPSTFSSPAAQAGAKKIYHSTQNRKAPAAFSKTPGVKNGAPVSVTRATVPVRRAPGQVEGRAIQRGKTNTPSPGPIHSRASGSPAPTVSPSRPAPAWTFKTPPAPRARVHGAPSFSSEVHNPPSTTSRGSLGGSPGGGLSTRSSSFWGTQGNFGRSR